MNSLPLIEELTPVPSIEETLRKLSGLPNLILFDSSLPLTKLGRYSFLSAEPFETFVLQQAAYRADPFAEISERMREFSATSHPDLPPFQGGAAGLLSYELGQCFERLPVAELDEFQISAAVIGLYDWVLAWDHQQNRCWFIGQGVPETSPSLRLRRAQESWKRVQSLLSSETSFVNSETHPKPIGEYIPAADQTPIPHLPDLRSNFAQPEYERAVQRVIDYIVAGDIFQANLSQRFLAPVRRSSVEQYLMLRRANPAPFAGYFAHDDWTVMSSSPERFLEAHQGHVSTRPIKGTRSRRSIPEADLYTRDELRESEKDRAENVMIVDLLRNDLSRVCRPGSIRVPELCSVEAYKTVSHLVSEVRGELQEGATFWDLLQVTFPGGSITGAPKIRAMQIITELERVARGPYCGSLFYHGFDGTADSNILIRTLTQRNGWLSFPAGGGIVSQSDPQQEYEETLHKARGMINALNLEHSSR